MKVVISGYGKMGHMVEAVAKARGIEVVLASEDIAAVPEEIAVGEGIATATPRNDEVARNDGEACNNEVEARNDKVACKDKVVRNDGEVSSLRACEVISLKKDCVCIDFTTPAAFRQNYAILAKKFKAVVVGTTGWEDIREEVFEAFRREGTTLIWASNFSIGVNAFFAAIQRVSSILKDNGYTPTVDETHHIHKLDAPSGTAISIANIIEENLGKKAEISSHRIGEVPGIHTAEFSSSVDKLSFTHEAFSREGFAQGAVLAAIMSEQLTGIHEFKDLLWM